MTKRMHWCLFSFYGSCIHSCMQVWYHYKINSVMSRSFSLSKHKKASHFVNPYQERVSACYTIIAVIVNIFTPRVYSLYQ